MIGPKHAKHGDPKPSFVENRLSGIADEMYGQKPTQKRNQKHSKVPPKIDQKSTTTDANSRKRLV
jgi:hypothetical protein